MVFSRRGKGRSSEAELGKKNFYINSRDRNSTRGGCLRECPKDEWKQDKGRSQLRGREVER